MNKKIKIGILSFAHMHGYSYAECLSKLENIEISAIYDDNVNRGKKISKKFNAIYYNDYKKLLKTDISAVVICSENTKHKQLTIAAAKEGKHILCEKPIATTKKDAVDMIETCEKYKVKLMTAFPCRFSTISKRVKQILDENKIGEILAIKGTNHGTMPGNWFIDKKLSGGGAVIDHTVHVADLIRWMIKKEFKNVYAEIDNLYYPELKIDDCGILIIELENGIFASIDPSWSRPNKSFPFWGDVTMRIIGTKGIIDMDLFNQKIVVYNNQQVKTNWSYYGDNIDMEMIRNFIDCIVNNKEVPVSGIDGLKALEVALAAYKSAKLKKLVNISEI